MNTFFNQDANAPKTFYLQTLQEGYGASERDVICSRILPDSIATLGEVVAETWLHAKAKFGFELTPLQHQMLHLDEAGRSAAQRRDSNYGRNPA